MGNSQFQSSKSTPLGYLLQNLKALGFQEEIRLQRLRLLTTVTLSGHNRLDNRSQWPENRTLDYSTLWYLNNFCCHNGKWSEIPSVQAFFALHSQPSLCESCSTSQILLAHSGPHPPHTMSPDPCSDFSSSSFNPSDHSPPLAFPIPLQPFQIQFHNLHLTSPPPSLLLKHRPPPQQLPIPLPSLCLR